MPETRCAQTAGISDRKEGLLPPYGTAISVRVARYENKERERKRGQSPFSRELSFSPFSVAISGKKTVRRMEIPSAYVKKSVDSREASFTDFSKLAVFQAFLQD